MTQWFVISTRTKGERKALTELRKIGIDGYLPQYQIERFNKRLMIRKVTTLCHFPGYLFAVIDRDRFASVRACEGVADVLPGFPREPIALSDKAVAALMALRDAEYRHLLDDTDQGRRARGETVKNTLEAMRRRLLHKEVRVINGPFTSFQGTVDIIHSLERLRVLINIFGRPTTLELQMGQIEEMAA